MSRRVILHIGGEKTGTTTLQLFLTLNAQQLKNIGFCYLSDAGKAYFGGYAHFPVAACLIEEEVDFVSEEKRRTLPLVLASLTKDIKDTDKTVILSCEHFSSRLQHKEQLIKLREAIGTADIAVVCYIREPSDLALSSYSTAVRCGCKQAFGIGDVTPENHYFNYLRILDLWSSVFGKQNVLVREFDKSALVDGDICRDFCELVGIDTQNMSPHNPANKSLDASKLEVLRFVNLGLPCRVAPTWRFSGSSVGEDRMAAPLRLQFDESIEGWRRSLAIRNVVSQCAPAGRPLKSLLSDEGRHTIRNRFDSVNREINGRYMSGKMSDNWFASNSEPNETKIDPNPCEGGDTAVSLRGTIIELADRLTNAESKLANTESKLAKAESSIAEAEAKLAAYERRLQKVYSTTAWRARNSFMKLKKRIGRQASVRFGKHGT